MTHTNFELPYHFFRHFALELSTRALEMAAPMHLSARVETSKYVIYQQKVFSSAFVVVAAAPVSKTGSDDDQAGRPHDDGSGNDWGPHSARPDRHFGRTIA